jgi:hypothetical protein
MAMKDIFFFDKEISLRTRKQLYNMQIPMNVALYGDAIPGL